MNEVFHILKSRFFSTSYFFSPLISTGESDLGTFFGITNAKQGSNKEHESKDGYSWNLEV
jgi:hypothetical protein